MIQLSTVMWVLAFFFAISGWNRGWNKELIATAGIILGLFALNQFDALLRQQLFGTLPDLERNRTIFFMQSIIFIIIVFFAYQTRALIGDDARRRDGRDGRDSLQESALGGILGFINGYLIWGSLWYFMDINRYPLQPEIVQPVAGSISAQTREILPLVILIGPEGRGDLLAIAVIALFLIVLIII
jgi:uncharacterized membrane protein required for colicin V production